MPIDTGSRIEFSCFFLTILTNGRMNESDELQSGLSLVKQAGQEIIKKRTPEEQEKELYDKSPYPTHPIYLVYGSSKNSSI